MSAVPVQHRWTGSSRDRLYGLLGVRSWRCIPRCGCLERRWGNNRQRILDSGDVGFLNQPRRTGRKKRRSVDDVLVVLNVAERELPGWAGVDHPCRDHFTDRHELAEVVERIGRDIGPLDLDDDGRVLRCWIEGQVGIVVGHPHDLCQNDVAHGVGREGLGWRAKQLGHIQPVALIVVPALDELPTAKSRSIATPSTVSSSATVAGSGFPAYTRARSAITHFTAPGHSAELILWQRLDESSRVRHPESIGNELLSRVLPALLRPSEAQRRLRKVREPLVADGVDPSSASEDLCSFGHDLREGPCMFAGGHEEYLGEVAHFARDLSGADPRLAGSAADGYDHDWALLRGAVQEVGERNGCALVVNMLDRGHGRRLGSGPTHLDGLMEPCGPCATTEPAAASATVVRREVGAFVKGRRTGWTGKN